MAPKASIFTERIAVFFSKEQLDKVKAEADKQGLPFSKEQLDKVKAEADKQGLPVSVFIRSTVLKAVDK